MGHQDAFWLTFSQPQKGGAVRPLRLMVVWRVITLARFDRAIKVVQTGAPFEGQWLVEGGHVQENPESPSSRKMVDLGGPCSIDTQEFGRRIVVRGQGWSGQQPSRRVCAAP